MTAGRIAVIVLVLAVLGGGMWFSGDEDAGSSVAPITLIDEQAEAVRREEDNAEVESVPDDDADDPTVDPPTRQRTRPAEDDDAERPAPDEPTTDDGQREVQPDPPTDDALTDDQPVAEQAPRNSAPAGPVADDTDAGDGDSAGGESDSADGDST